MNEFDRLKAQKDAIVERERLRIISDAITKSQDSADRRELSAADIEMRLIHLKQKVAHYSDGSCIYIDDIFKYIAVQSEQITALTGKLAEATKLLEGIALAKGSRPQVCWKCGPAKGGHPVVYHYCHACKDTAESNEAEVKTLRAERYAAEREIERMLSNRTAPPAQEIITGTSYHASNGTSDAPEAKND